MSTLLIALIAILGSLPAGTTLEWRGEIVEPSAIIKDLMDSQENVNVPAEETTGATAPAEETADEATPAEEEAAPAETIDGSVNERQGNTPTVSA